MPERLRRLVSSLFLLQVTDLAALEREVAFVNLRRARLASWFMVAIQPGLFAVELLFGTWQQTALARASWFLASFCVLLATRGVRVAEDVARWHRWATGAFAGACLCGAAMWSAWRWAAGGDIAVYWAGVFAVATILRMSFWPSLLAYGASLLLLSAQIIASGAHTPTTLAGVTNAVLATVAALVVARLTYEAALRDAQQRRTIAQLLRNLEDTNTQLAAANTALQRESYLDPLTGVANRRSLDQCLEREYRRAAREGQSIALLMVDVDYFKEFNNAHGHLAGDDCLVDVAAAIREALNRPGDQVIRYGGDEFVVLLPNTDAAGARHVAERIAARVKAGSRPSCTCADDRRVTVSVGVASTLPTAAGSPQALLAAADRSLFLAKASRPTAVQPAGEPLPEAASASAP